MSSAITKAPIRIRLARFGRKNQPLYNIVVANRKAARDKLPIEVLGTYDPVPIPLSPEEKAKGVKPYKHIELDFDRAQYWLGVGAEVSERVGFLFKKAGLLPEFWPQPSSLSQHVSKPLVSGPKTVLEEEQELIRKR
ncbi:37S ribosomal protein S16, mitochondrial [Scheffersomyces spartinae]|uniref:37S ribosomal protein S16, mitochondrial n=1 Tax=Scheffersomyces spartinae TaxID=45513 RepID=A0A9P8AGL1_9ASCO|nr:37S ribosomal protein S16, mitochondrial [Scheffersomyces spartinae]KAG7192475.1 37S ribosomal protein S16, mitochondrial [Scheffersomyces spartinae]